MTATFGLTMHHLGLAVSREDDARRFLDGLGYEFGELVYDPEQDVNLRLATGEALPTIELIMPGERDGPLTPILKRYNELIYHTCYESLDPEASIAAMEHAGLRVMPVAEPRPAVLFGGRRVSFHAVPGFGLIELLEAPNPR